MYSHMAMEVPPVRRPVPLLSQQMLETNIPTEKVYTTFHSTENCKKPIEDNFLNLPWPQDLTSSLESLTQPLPLVELSFSTVRGSKMTTSTPQATTSLPLVSAQCRHDTFVSPNPQVLPNMVCRCCRCPSSKITSLPEAYTCQTQGGKIIKAK